jgi:hypothetical protein
LLASSKFNAVAKQELVKKSCVKKPLQKRFYHVIKPVLSRKRDLALMERKASLLTFTVVLLVVLLLVAPAPSLKAAYEAPQVQWEKTYGPYEGYSLVQTVDGGYAIAGQQAAFREFQPHLTSGWENKTALLVKVDASGNVEWTKTYDNEVGGGWQADSVVQTTDSSYTIIGLQQGRTTTKNIVFLINTDSNGKTLWNITIAWPGDTMGCEGIQTSDGGYLLAGSSRYGESQSGIAWVLKTDENGKTLWNRTFGNFNSNQLFSVRALAVAEADDGGYLVAGHWMDDCWFAKTDANGNLQWNQTYDFRFENEILTTYMATSIIQAADGGYILAGGNGYRGFLVKTTSEGVMEWNRHYVDGSAFSSIVQAANGYGYFAVGGFSYPSDAGAWFVRLDSSGDLLWNSTRAIHDAKISSLSTARSVVKTSDGGYAVTGALNSTVWLVKFAPEPPALPDNTSPPPNPVSPQFPTTLIVATVIIAAVIGLGLLVYFKKRKR